MTARKAVTDNGFIIFKDQLSILKTIPNEKIGEAIKLLLENFDELPIIDNIAYEIIAINIRRYREQSIISSGYGKKGGNPTLKGTFNPTLNPTLKPTLKQQEKTKQDITDIKKKYQKEFEEFWKEYPKQRAGSKEKAYTSYCKAIDKNKITTEKLLEVVKRYAVSKEVREGYAKGCAAWLNDDRFNDEKLNPFVGVRGNWYYCEDGTRVEL